MSAVKDMTQLGKLVAHHHGWPAAKAFKSYVMGQEDQAVLSRCALDLLKIFPDAPLTAGPMSAALAVSLERHMKAPIHLVAGNLCVAGEPVLGSRQCVAGPEAFEGEDADWQGHVWLMIGPYIVDIALFRIAYSASGPAQLSKHVDLAFGPNKGLYVEQWKRTRRQGLDYEPHYVLSPEEVTAQMGRAYALIQTARG